MFRRGGIETEPASLSRPSCIVCGAQADVCGQRMRRRGAFSCCEKASFVWMP